ncbi:unnamed protein product [Closterium sp. NIES-65]|nr:unnamed protein product [Closterium sp. NIES-65]
MDGRGQSSHAPRRRSSFDGILREQATTPKVTPATVAGSDGGLRRRQIGRQPQQTSQQPSQQQRRQEQQQQQQQRGADKKSGDKADKGEKGLEKSEKFDRSGRFERSESRRGGRWGCIDSCCWTMGNAVFLWFLLMLAYHLMPRQQIQAIQDALVGLPEVEPPGARLAGEGVKAKHPVVFVPGIVTVPPSPLSPLPLLSLPSSLTESPCFLTLPPFPSHCLRAFSPPPTHPLPSHLRALGCGLELWEGRPCAADLFRKRLWGGTFGDAYRRPGCWMEHMLLDNETGLDPPGIRVRPVSGLVAADYFLPGYFVWAVIIEQLAKIGYEERNMFMAAYDWRLSFYNTQKRDQTLSRLKATIEMLVKTNEGKKAVVVPHSMGVLYFLFFMKWVEAPAPLGGGGGPQWVHNHIRAVFNIGGPLLGAPKAFTGLFSAEAKDVAAIRALDPGVFGSLQALQHVMRVSRTWDATMSMLPKGGEAVWGNATWAPEDSFNCSKARAKQLHLQQQQQAGESGGNSSKAGGDGRAKGSGKGLGVEGFLRTLMAEGASSSAPSSSSPSSASSAAATASTTGAHSEGSGDGGQSGSEGDGAKAVARAAAATCPATFHSYFPLLYVSFGEASATLSESLVCPSGAKAAARAAAATCPAASTCPATWGGQQYVLSDPCSCAMRDLLPEGDDEYSDETAYKGAEGKGGASSGGERDESEGKEEKAPVRESRRKQWQRQLEETVFQHLQSRNKSCGEVWTEYHDMSWHALKDIANCPFYTAGDESDGPSGGILGLLRQVAPKTMARADENWSYGIAGDLSERKYAEEPKYWANPLETSLPDAPEMEVYCAYGTGLLTERAYVYRLSPSNDTCLIPFRIDASANGPPGQAGDCLTEGAYFTDGDETAPVLSMGLPCAKLWRGRTRFNPAASPTYLREYEHRPTSGLLAGRSTQSGSHVDIMGNFALIEDILRVAAGATGAEIGGDQIYSDILHWAERVSIKL